MGIPLSVLIVEDSEDDMFVLLDTLQSNGYDTTYEWVDTAVGMSAALERQPWDVIVCDYIIPGFGAQVALEIVQTKDLDIPFIITSGTINEETAVSALKAGAHDFVLKNRLARLIPAIEREMREAEIRRQHKQTQQALKSANSYIKTILESITDAFVAVDRQWRFTYVNQEAAKLLKKTREELLGKYVWEDIFPQTSDRNEIAYQEFHRAVAEQVTVDFEYFSQILDCWIEAHAYPSSEGLAVYFRDITERKKAETEREKLLAAEQTARAEAEAANRLKDEFLATLSHELRSPLTPIIGWSNLLRTHTLDKESINRALGVIESNAHSQARLVEDLLDVSRIIRGQLTLNVCPVDIVPVIQSAIDTVQTAADAKHIRLHRFISASALIVSGDANRLRQIVWNLVTNAVKFTSEGGRVEVRVEKTSQNINKKEFDSAEQSQIHPSEYVQITVTDSGIGIDTEFLPYVFDRFRQADSSITRIYSGLGLGLSIVRHLVELHGGTVKADSQGEGHGATFTVNIPVMAVSKQGSQPKQVQRTSLATGLPFYCLPELQNLRVLLVEDEDDVRELFAYILKECGIEVLSARTVKQAISILKAQTLTSPVDVLISDIGMPNEDGYALLHKVRELPPEQGGQIPAIALTAYAREEDSQAALSAGFQMHLTKPVEPAKLTAAILKLAKQTIRV